MDRTMNEPPTAANEIDDASPRMGAATEGIPLRLSVPLVLFVAFALSLMLIPLWGGANINQNIYTLSALGLSWLKALMFWLYAVSLVVFVVSLFVGKRVFVPLTSVVLFYTAAATTFFGLFWIFTTTQEEIISGLPEDALLGLAIDKTVYQAFRNSGFAQGGESVIKVFWWFIALFWVVSAGATWFAWRSARRYPLYAKTLGKINAGRRVAGKGLQGATKAAGQAAGQAAQKASSAAERLNQPAELDKIVDEHSGASRDSAERASDSGADHSGSRP